MTYRSDVIATAKATGCVLQYWNSLLVGDELTILSIVDDNKFGYLTDAVFETSNIEEWKNFRFNYRGLSRFPSALIGGILPEILILLKCYDCNMISRTSTPAIVISDMSAYLQ